MTAVPGLALVAALLLAVVTVDVGGYLVAASAAQAAADAAATAAAAAPLAGGGAPEPEARRIAAMHGGRLEDCTCGRRTREVVVAVSVPVRALVATRLGPRRVTARAAARLVPRPP